MTADRESVLAAIVAAATGAWGFFAVRRKNHADAQGASNTAFKTAFDVLNAQMDNQAAVIRRLSKRIDVLERCIRANGLKVPSDSHQP